MTPQEVLQILQNRVSTLNNAVAIARSAGDLNEVVKYQNDLDTTNNTIASLTKLVSDSEIG